MTIDSRFCHMGFPRKVWAVPAIHGEIDRLRHLHSIIGAEFLPGDRLIYLGNYLGGGQPCETINELLDFRRALLSMPGMKAEDIVYLRGAQEEIWQKLLQIQFAPCPRTIFGWMAQSGVAATLEAYGSSVEEGEAVVRDGVLALTKWTNRLRNAIRRHPGHEKFFTVLRRAAFTEAYNDNSYSSGRNLLFVNAGIDPTQSLIDQGDSFWWRGDTFYDMHEPYEPFHMVVRGFDPTQQGIRLNGVTMSLDGGCGFGGPLVAGQINHEGQLLDVVQA